eukprot:TRINITY_DN2753_c0_g1_i1.p1 TRINITY_DN2753_c0_g1~~TRINITY_DN2753_c0_g1_i1.p1  ORF type:complete len:162 (-),score=21.00 TRINITY_DN2753_c0_g1_i1:26-511(-)
MLGQIRSALAPRYQSRTWIQLYRSSVDGIAMGTFFRRVKSRTPLVLVIRDSQNTVFGAFLTGPCDPEMTGFVGTGETFLFTFYPSFRTFGWTGQNSFFVSSKIDSVGIGCSNSLGQSGFGIYLADDFSVGSSRPTPTFDNPCLTIDEQFVPYDIECYALGL